MNGSGPDSEKDPGMVSFESEEACPGPRCLDLTVQGRALHYHGDRDIRSLLESQGQNSLYANVRINGDVLSRRDFENIPIEDGDNIDFLYYMGGG